MVETHQYTEEDVELESHSHVRNSQSTEIYSIRPAGDIVPPQSIAGRALIFVVIIMSFLACLTIGSVTVVWNSANDWNNQIIREVTIQLRPQDGVDLLTEIEKAIEISKNHPGVDDAHVVSENETRELLQPWLGKNFDIELLPVPRIVKVEISDPSLVDLNLLRALIRSNVQGGTLDDHSIWTSRLAAMANVLVFIGLGVLSLVMASMILCVVFATRAAMAGNKDVVSVLHFVGADERFIVREFQRHFLFLGLIGGVIGGVLTILVIFLIEFLIDRLSGGVGTDQIGALFGNSIVDFTAYAGIISVVVVVAVLTAVTSRLAMYSHLRKIR